MNKYLKEIEQQVCLTMEQVMMEGAGEHDNKAKRSARITFQAHYRSEYIRGISRSTEWRKSQRRHDFMGEELHFCDIMNLVVDPEEVVPASGRG